MSLERVVITGLGAVSALGIGTETNFSRALAGSSGIDFLALPSLRQLEGHVAAQIKFPLPELIKKADLALFDRVSILSWIAASEALAQSRISGGSSAEASTGSSTEPAPEFSERSGVFWGTGMGGAQTLENGYVDLFVENKERVRPMSVVAGMNNAAASQIALRCGFAGTVNTYTSACVSSAQAIGEAFRHIRHGYADRVLAGGAEALLTYGVVSSWDAMRVLAPAAPAHPERSCLPFSKERKGLVLGEAGAAIMLESLSSARARGAVILAEVVGYGSSNDASHISKPNPQGQARAMRAALTEAGMAPEDIDYINAHAAGTLAGDSAEAQSLSDVFGGRKKKPLVSATKSVHGHTLGAAGALEFVMTVQTLRSGNVPPTAFLEESDPEFAFDFVPRQAREHQPIRAAMSNSFAFGGSNAALIVKKYTP